MNPDKGEGHPTNRHSDWQCDEFAAQWASGPVIGNPSRPFQLQLIVSILRKLSGAAPGFSILELGSGAGLVTDRILSELPCATVDGIENSPYMLRAAAERLARYAARFRQRIADLGQFDAAVLNGERYNAIVALQVLHELPPMAKIDVLARLRGHLQVGGLLIYGERIRPDYKSFDLPLQALWESLCAWTPQVRQPSYEDRVRQVQATDDHVVTLAEELAAFSEAGYQAEPLVVLGERCLLVLRPRNIEM